MGDFQRKSGQFIRKNGITILLGAFLVAMVVSPDVKAWVLRQLMVTGLFNAGMDEKKADAAPPAIDFEVTDANSYVLNTASLRGKVVFINFWASWCPPCRAEFPSIEKLYARFRNHPDVFFLTISEDRDPAAAKQYLEKEGYTVPHYRIAGPVPESVYSGTLPTTVVLDKQGTIRLHHEGFANYASEKFIKQMEALIGE